MTIHRKPTPGRRDGGASFAIDRFRRFPARAGDQRRIRSDHDACRFCLGGTCCSSEDPIALTPFDVLRLATSFDLSPANFLLAFTQDRFADDDDKEAREPWRQSPDSSVVTWLRRRANSRHSPCVFLKYVTDEDGAPRRICSVHDARPLACREYYHDTCKTRWTGELATLQAHGFEAIRDGLITSTSAKVELERADADLQDRPDSAPILLRRAFWTEMRRALHAGECNEEGARSFDPAPWQDPLPEKVDRLLSRRHLRLEERYGPIPWGDQLQPFEGGVEFARSSERDRLLRIVESRPTTDHFTRAGDYPLFVAFRDWLPGTAPARGFPILSEAAMMRNVRGAPDSPGFPGHRDPATRSITPRQVALATHRGVNFLARTAAWVRALDRVLELSEPGVLEGWLTALSHELLHQANGALPVHPALESIQTWAAARPGSVANTRIAARRLKRIAAARPIDIARLVANQDQDGGFGSRPDRTALAASHEDHLRDVVWRTIVAVLSLARVRFGGH